MLSQWTWEKLIFKILFEKNEDTGLVVKVEYPNGFGACFEMGKNVIGCGLYVFHLSRDGIYVWVGSVVKCLGL